MARVDRNIITQVLHAIPPEWNGTTFKNDKHSYIGRAAFANNLNSLIAQKDSQHSSPISTHDLVELGNA